MKPCQFHCLTLRFYGLEKEEEIKRSSVATSQTYNEQPLSAHTGTLIISLATMWPRRFDSCKVCQTSLLRLLVLASFDFVTGKLQQVKTRVFCLDEIHFTRIHIIVAVGCHQISVKHNIVFSQNGRQHGAMQVSNSILIFY